MASKEMSDNDVKVSVEPEQTETSLQETGKNKHSSKGSKVRYIPDIHLMPGVKLNDKRYIDKKKCRETVDKRWVGYCLEVLKLYSLFIEGVLKKTHYCRSIVFCTPLL